MSWNGSGGSRATDALSHPKARGGSWVMRHFAVGVSFVAIASGVLFWSFFSDSVPKEALSWRRSKGKLIMDDGEARPTSASTTASVSTGVLASVERKSALPRTREDIAPPEPLADVVEKARPCNRLFKTSTEAYISMATPSAPGVGVPPVPIPADVDFSEDMKRAFSTPIMAEEGDDEETIGRKLAVLDAKNQLQELAEKEHWTLQQFVKAIRDKHISDGDYLAECHAAIERAYADPEISDTSYLAIRDKVNETLRDRGLPEIMAYGEEEAADGDSSDGAEHEPKSTDRQPQK